jgi:uncharacterized oxidoreductase
MPIFQPQSLYAVARLMTHHMGCADSEAAEIADHLVKANLTGHDSHGVGMLPTYVRMLREGLLVPNQEAHTVLDSGPLLVIDARNGCGQRMAADAVQRAIDRARVLGACVLALRNSSHVGRIGAYAELATRSGCAFTAFVNVAGHNDIAAPYGSGEARLGTNPFCTAVPGANGRPVMLDMATTTIAAGKARVAYNKGLPVPDGCLIDPDGTPTNDPTGFIRDQAGALRTFGAHKGSGMAIMCEIMATAVAGGRGAFEPAQNGILNSMLAIVIDLSKLGDTDEIAARIEGTTAHIKSARPAPGFAEILLPGDPEHRSTAWRSEQGIEVDNTTWHDIRTAAVSLGITDSAFDQAAGTNRT